MNTLRDQLLEAGSIEKAVELLFNLKINGRQKVLPGEELTPEVCAAYDFVGKNNRLETYQKIVEDVVTRTMLHLTPEQIDDTLNIVGMS